MASILQRFLIKRSIKDCLLSIYISTYLKAVASSLKVSGQITSKQGLCSSNVFQYIGMQWWVADKIYGPKKTKKQRWFYFNIYLNFYWNVVERNWQILREKRRNIVLSLFSIHFNIIGFCCDKLTKFLCNK